MKRFVVMFSVIALMFLGHFSPAKAQAEEKEKKDSISVDSADPVFYDAAEDAVIHSSLWLQYLYPQLSN